jgi:hypothetical protein
MISRLHRTPGRLWVAARLLLASFVFGQLGIGPGVLAAWTGGADPCCDRTCPCEQVADAGSDTHGDHGEDACPEEGTEQQCPPGCDDCTCCPGAVFAVAPGLAPCPGSPREGPVFSAAPDTPAAGVPGLIFRPPRALPRLNPGQ